MTITSFERGASILEMAVEIDRRGAVIEALEAEIERLRERAETGIAGRVDAMAGRPILCEREIRATP